MLYYDLDTHAVKTCQHVVFHEADVPLAVHSFNIQLLKVGGDSSSPDIVDIDQSYPDLDMSCSPFTSFHTLTFLIDLGSDLRLGFSLSKCDQLKCGYLQDICVAPIGHHLCAFKKTFAHAYIVSVNDVTVFSPDNVKFILIALCSNSTPASTIDMVLAPE